jgi:hypothetical protein
MGKVKQEADPPQDKASTTMRKAILDPELNPKDSQFLQ